MVMNFDVLESGALDKAKVDLQGKMDSLRGGFESSLKSRYDAFTKMPNNVDSNIAHWLGANLADGAADMSALRVKAMASAQQMYNGISYEDLWNHCRGWLRHSDERRKKQGKSTVGVYTAIILTGRTKPCGN